MIKTILITCGGGLQALTLFKELEEMDNVIVHVIDTYKQNLTKYKTPFYSISPPTSEKENYQNYLLEYIEKNQITDVFPATIYDLELLSNQKEYIKQKYNCNVHVSASKLLSILLNKEKTYKWLFENFVSTFEVIEVQNLESNLPIFGKEREGWGGKNTKSIHSKDELEQTPLEELECRLWTKKIENFDEFSIDFAIKENGQVSKIVVRKRERVLTGFAVIMNTIVLNENDKLKILITDTIECLRKNGAAGIFNVQILEDTLGSFFVSDINPRVGTSSVMGKYLNANLCKFLLIDSLETSNFTFVQKETRLVRLLEETLFPALSISLKEVEGIVFDLDDTLIFHKSWIHDKLYSTLQIHKEIFEKYSIDSNEVVNYGHCLVDEGYAPVLFDKLCDKFGLDSYKLLFIETYRNHQPKTIEVYNDVLTTLSYLKKKYKLAILTDNPVVSQKQKINVFPYADYFDAIVYSNEYKINKPDALAFQTVTEKLGISADKLIMVGDNFYRDIAGAIKANYKYAFQINRKNSLFNTNNYTTMYVDKFSTLNDLTQLSYYI